MEKNTKQVKHESPKLNSMTLSDLERKSQILTIKIKEAYLIKLKASKGISILMMSELLLT